MDAVLRPVLRYPLSNPVRGVPLALSSFSVTGGPGPFLGNVPLSFTTEADPNLTAIALYRVPYGGTLNKSSHFFKRVTAQVGTTFAHTIGDATTTNLLANGDFSVDANWTKGAGWTISGGVATKTASAVPNLTQTGLAAMTADVYRYSVEASNITAGTVIPFTAPTAVLGTAITTNGRKLGTITPTTGQTYFGFSALPDFAGSLDNAYFYKQTATCTSQGDWDWYAIPENAVGAEGPASTAQRATVV